jgi:hypothetical protein
MIPFVFHLQPLSFSPWSLFPLTLFASRSPRLSLFSPLSSPPPFLNEGVVYITDEVGDFAAAKSPSNVAFGDQVTQSLQKIDRLLLVCSRVSFFHLERIGSFVKHEIAVQCM